MVKQLSNRSKLQITPCARYMMCLCLALSASITTQQIF